MEKISDSQIKFTLSLKDLKLRNINIKELTYESEKTRRLFKEMLDEAEESCNFRPENTPLMIEAIPKDDGIMIIISKVDNSANLKSGFDFMPESKSFGKFKTGDYMDIREMPQENLSPSSSKISVYSFDSMDSASEGSKRIASDFNGESSLYKLSGSYCLILQRKKPSSEIGFDNIETLLGEYGEKTTSTVIFAAYLREHGEPIIKSGAVSILSTIF
ncbi:MAG: adaptor protein MecA [Clostridiales bacterium]|nr:adaptor protein MecA [Clostridiales bacterium]